MNALIQDFRNALRQLWKKPGFTLVAVLTLALGLTAVSTIFAVVETVLLRPLNFPRSDRIVVISLSNAALGPGQSVATLGQFQRWQQSGLLQRAAAIETSDYTLLGQGRAEKIFGVEATPEFFQVFGVQPFLGRGFVAGDATPGHDNAVVLSHQLWMRSFGSDRNIVGKTIRTSDGSLTVIGVMPPRFDFPRLADVRAIMEWAPERTEFWTPLTITEKRVQQGNWNYYVLGRLNDGVTTERAAEQFHGSATQLLRDNEAQDPAYREEFERLLASLRVEVTPLRDSLSWGVREVMWMLLAAVGLLLALVLFNLGNLLLTRNVGRLREFVARVTLGATRWRLFRESLAEQVLLVMGAAIVSMLLSAWALSGIRSVAAERLPRLYELSIDGRVTTLLLALSFLISIMFGAAPLIVLPNSAIASLLRSDGRILTADRRTHRIKSALMATQIGVSAVLLIGAGLLIQSFTNVMRVSPGFDPQNLLSISVSLNPKTNEGPAKRVAHTRELLAAFRNIPGVESASVVNHVALTGETDIHTVRAVGRSPSPGDRRGAEYRIVDADYFRTMRIPLIAGREFREDEPAGFAIINRKMASNLWPNEDAVGKQVRDGENPPVTVVGVVEDIHDGSLESEPRMQFYQPLAADPWSEEFMIRARIDSAAVLPIAEQTVWRQDPEQSVSHPQTMERLLQSTTLDRQFETSLVVGFAAAALFLATVGLFSTASLSVTHRTREFGVRVALGAKGPDLLRLELWRTLGIVLAGLACGVAASLALARTVGGFLYGVTAWSPKVYIGAIVVLITPALVAAWLPARRAAKVDPMVALRYE
ncbi:putative Macrolide transporter ATP-binding /permease protein [Candidatus Sulfotelmatobacter kueseliae]|uniref:Putative Macrolide transporter ATP-binding /permease protein n=1 Tax=Candidatus Sulfotelmatobacter kueseliae TaxID=2042962 RepID=A0A2U3KPZ3_9BACT|nr:putative Macrolide transporter ATP-binding /permease protein [Candidatus Sulfotelmatobacter kueseliae]